MSMKCLKQFCLLGFLFLGIGVMAHAQPCTSRTTAEHDISTWRMVRVFYDNDFPAGTNRYYTSGLRVEYIAPSCFYVWTSRLLFRWGLRSRTYYGFSFNHQLFTPESLELGYQDLRDRPFAGTVSGSHFMISNLREEKLRFTTEIQAGLLGPLALGRYLGAADSLWEDQIGLDLILGYRAKLQKGLLETSVFDLGAYGEAQVNTALTYAEAGLGLRLGRVNPPFYDLDFALKSLRPMGRRIHDLQAYLYANASARFVAYDATLQGGLLNGSSPYTLMGSEITRLPLRLSVGFNFLYKFIGVGYEHTFQNPQFDGANAHNFGQFKLWVAW